MKSRVMWLGVFLSVSMAVFGQDTASITGTVTDPSGAAVGGAQVTLNSPERGINRETQTNADGEYLVGGLPPGPYKLSISTPGFKKYEAGGIILRVAQKARADAALQVGAAATEVTVEGAPVGAVETQTNELAGTITGKEISQLQLNGRVFTQLITLTPGVSNQTGSSEGVYGIYGNTNYSVNGGRLEYNNWELDGGDNMDNGSNATLNVTPSADAISEVRVLTSNYGAQYGRNGSGTVEVETKSGTSAFHGSAFEYLRNDVFNAKSWSEGADPTAHKAPYKKHDFGYTLGGPVYIPGHYNKDKKKTFFFWSQEWRREKNPFTTSPPPNVPSDAERTGNFSELCSPTAGVIDNTNFPDCPVNPATSQRFPGDTVTIDPVGQALLSLIPTANTTHNGFPAVLQTVSLPETWREELVRVDHNITDNYRLTFRYIHDSWQTQTQNPLWGNGTNFENINTEFVGPGTSFVARLNANISPTLLNEFVASYTADHIFLTALNNPPIPSGFAMGSLFNNGLGGKLPAISLGSNPEYGSDGSLTADTGYFPWNNANPVYTYRDNVTKIIGTHTLQFGAYAAFAQKNEQNSPYIQGILTFDSSNTTIPSTGNAFADLLTGRIAQYQQTNLQAKYYNRYRLFEPYFQDDWRMTKKFTLNLGLRLSLYGTYRERYHHAFSFAPADFNAANSPLVDDGTQTGTEGAFVPGTGNPFNGIIQCGSSGGTGDIPGNTLAAFPAASIGSSSNAGCMKGHLFNPAPRFGFAWDPGGDGKMAIRGGYGVFFEHTNGNEGNTESLEGSAPFSLTSSQFNINGYSNIGGGLLFPLSVTSIPEKAIWPYVKQWHLDVQRELPGNFIATVSYVGSKGTHLTLQRNLNQLLPVAASDNPYLAAGRPITPEIDDASGNVIYAGDCATNTAGPGGPAVTGAAATNLGIACGNDPNPFRPLLGFGNITRLENQANSVYHALQTTVRRTVGNLTLSVAYTYSHSIDDSSDRFDSAFVNSYDLSTNRASSDFDVRHNLAISYVYGLPFFKNPGLAHTILGGWQVSGITIAQSGTPFSVTNGTDFGDAAGVANGVGTGSRPDLVGNPNSSVQSDVPTVRGKLFYDPAAFAAPIGLTFGNVGRNTLKNPSRVNFDFGLFKRFAFGERRQLL